MYYIKLFNLNSDYINYIESEDVLLPNVSFVKETKTLFFNQSVDDDEPIDPPTVTPETNIGTITNNNSIVIDETQLENGVYTLKYIDSNGNIIDNFNDITTFEINN